MSQLKISDEKIAEFQANGAVLLQDVFSKKWVDLVRDGVELNMKNPSEFGEWLKVSPEEGAYFSDYCNWQNIPQFRCYALESVASQIAAQLMQSQNVTFYHEHVLVKEPGTAKETPWHQDQPYYPVDGFKNVSLWMPLDVVDESAAVQFVRGSHLWSKWYHPRYFASESNYLLQEHRQTDGGRIYHNVPVDEIAAGKWDILKWTAKPGDCIAFHMLTLHGAPGNLSPDKYRRVLSTRWLGEDAVLAKRPWKVSPPFLGGLDYGHRICGQTFPLI